MRPSDHGAADDAPDVYIMRHQYGRIEHLAHVGLPPRHLARRLLIDKLERARVFHAEDTPRDVVTVDSRVLFAIDGAPAETRVVVYPERYFPTGQYVSLANPVGAALLGLREGDETAFSTLEGGPFSIRVKRVLRRPEATGCAVATNVSGR